MTPREVTLMARDAEDLEVIAARLQDAVAPLGELAWLPKSRRFAALFNRFKWEESGKRTNLRVRSLLHFESVLSVKYRNIRAGARDAVVSLLTIAFSPKGGEDPGGTVELVFSGGGVIRLEVECLDASLGDVGKEWAARGRPVHDET